MITPADIEQEIRTVTSRLEVNDLDRQEVLAGAAAIAGVIALGAIYIAGQRRGKHHTTIVEIRSA